MGGGVLPSPGDFVRINDLLYWCCVGLEGWMEGTGLLTLSRWLVFFVLFTFFLLHRGSVPTR